MKNTLCYVDSIPSPLGDLWAVIDEAGALVELGFGEGVSERERKADLIERFAAQACEVEFAPDRLAPVAEALARYFEGTDHTFDLAVAPHGTPFQQTVWNELQRIPWGQTISYGELARRVGRPGAARAVGRANATNPVAVVIPCHRVIGANGTLTGYAGGMRRKEALLTLEGALPGSLFPTA